MWSSLSRNPNVSGRRCVRSTFYSLRVQLVGALVGLALCLGVNAVVASQALRYEAESVLLNYFTALQTGDVGALGQILGGELRVSFSVSLRNPEYAAELVRDYGVAEFQVLDLQLLDSGDMVAIVETRLQPSEFLRHRLTLRRGESSRGFQIVSSEFVP